MLLPTRWVCGFGWFWLLSSTLVSLAAKELPRRSDPEPRDSPFGMELMRIKHVCNWTWLGWCWGQNDADHNLRQQLYQGCCLYQVTVSMLGHKLRHKIEQMCSKWPGNVSPSWTMPTKLIWMSLNRNKKGSAACKPMAFKSCLQHHTVPFY